MPYSVAVVGGGLAGLSCAVRLVQHGIKPTLIDMGTRGPGGRASSKTVDGAQMDAGCQFLLPRSEAFAAAVAGWVDAGVAAPWEARLGTLHADSGQFVERGSHPATGAPGFFGLEEAGAGAVHAGLPSMGAVAQHLAGRLREQGAVLLGGSKVTRLAWDASRSAWQLQGARGRGDVATAQDLGSFDAVVAADALIFTPGSAGYAELEGPEMVHQLADRVRSVPFAPTFALLAGFARPPLPEPGFDGVSVAGEGASFQWLANDSSKPGRGGGPHQRWVALASRTRAAQLQETAMPVTVGGAYSPQAPAALDGVAAELAPELLSLLAAAGGGAEVPRPAWVRAQRWGRAFAERPLGEPCLAAPALRLAACGDWCLGGGAEGAWLSGAAAADAVAGG